MRAATIGLDRRSICSKYMASIQWGEGWHRAAGSIKILVAASTIQAELVADHPAWPRANGLAALARAAWAETQ